MLRALVIVATDRMRSCSLAPFLTFCTNASSRRGRGTRRPGNRRQHVGHAHHYVYPEYPIEAVHQDPERARPEGAPGPLRLEELGDAARQWGQAVERERDVAQGGGDERTEVVHLPDRGAMRSSMISGELTPAPM